MINVHQVIGTHDIVLITLDTLRYDVAQEQFLRGATPFLATLLPARGWEPRHTPGSFTYAAHQAFFAGFLPTPIAPGKHSRLFAARFPGSETTDTTTFVFDAPDIVSGLTALDYHTICIGGVGFFNQQSPLGCVLPNLFAESYWRPDLGVTEPRSTEYQVELACASVQRLQRDERVFLFLNISAIHQPNYFYLSKTGPDSLESHGAALAYVDGQLPRLFAALRRRAPLLVIICADHGTAYGEDGYVGHRIAHPVVWMVPYVELVLSQQE